MEEKKRISEGEKKLLYIEDDSSSRQLVRRSLQPAGYNVIEVGDGLSGIEAASREVPDLILMDIGLPDMDGFEAAIKIKSMSWLNHIPIVALTAYTGSGDRERAITAGCEGYIAKPIDIGALPTQVKEFLSGKRETVDREEQVYYLKEHSQKLVDRLEIKIKELSQASDRLQELNKDSQGNRLKDQTIGDFAVDRALMKEVAEISDSVSPRNDQIVREAKEFIQGNFSRELSLREVSAKVYLSPCYFSQIFKKETGDTFLSFLTGVRVQEAKKLLREIRYNVSQVAYKVGYHNPRYFSQVFRKFEGLTPSQFREGKR